MTTLTAIRPGAPAESRPLDEGQVTVYFDRGPTPEMPTDPLRLVPNGLDPAGESGAEFGADVPRATLARWQQAREAFAAVLAEQQAVRAQIEAREQPMVDAAAARRMSEAQAQAEEEASWLTGLYGMPSWVVNKRHDGKRHRRVTGVSVHRVGCPVIAKWPSYRRTGVRLDEVIGVVRAYDPAVGYGYASSVAPRFCARCTTRVQVADIKAAVVLRSEVHVPATHGEPNDSRWVDRQLAKWLVRGETEQFAAFATLRALQGIWSTVPSGVPIQ